MPSENPIVKRAHVTVKTVRAILTYALFGIKPGQIAESLRVSPPTVYRYLGGFPGLAQLRAQLSEECQGDDALLRARVETTVTELVAGLEAEQDEKRQRRAESAAAKVEALMAERRLRAERAKQREQDKRELRALREQWWLALKRVHESDASQPDDPQIDAQQMATWICEIEVLDKDEATHTCRVDVGGSVVKMSTRDVPRLEALLLKGAHLKESQDGKHGMLLFRKNKQTSLLRMVALWRYGEKVAGSHVVPVNGDYYDCRRTNVRVTKLHKKPRVRKTKPRVQVVKPRQKPGPKPKDAAFVRKTRASKWCSQFVRPAGVPYTGHFEASIRLGGEDVALGIFGSELEAAQAYNETATRIYGSKARLIQPT